MGGQGCVRTVGFDFSSRAESWDVQGEMQTSAESAGVVTPSWHEFGALNPQEGTWRRTEGTAHPYLSRCTSWCCGRCLPGPRNLPARLRTQWEARTNVPLRSRRPQSSAETHATQSSRAARRLQGDDGGAPSSRHTQEGLESVLRLKAEARS